MLINKQDKGVQKDGGGTATSERVVRKDSDNMTFEKRWSEIRERAIGLAGGRALGQRGQHSGFPGRCGGAYTEEQGGQHGGGREEGDGWKSAGAGHREIIREAADTQQGPEIRAGIP